SARLQRPSLLPALPAPPARRGPRSEAPPLGPAPARAEIAPAAAVTEPVAVPERELSAVRTPAAQEVPGQVPAAALEQASPNQRARLRAVRGAVADRSIRDWPACRCESVRHPVA